MLLGAVEILGTIMCVILIHYTGKRPLVLISTVGVGLGFFGTATYANFLHSVPGISVDNVVANVSALDLNKANIITIMNVPQILGSSFLESYNNESLRNDTIEDSDDNYSHVMKVRDISDSLDNEYAIPLTMYDDFNSTNFNFEMDETESPLTSNFTTDQENKTVEAAPIVADNKKNILDTLVIQIPKAEENKFLWLPLSLLLMSAFFAHMGIKLIPWMLIGEVYSILCTMCICY